MLLSDFHSLGNLETNKTEKYSVLLKLRNFELLPIAHEIVRLQ